MICWYPTENRARRWSIAHNHSSRREIPQGRGEGKLDAGGRLTPATSQSRGDRPAWCTGEHFRAILASAVHLLAGRVETINNLNVFPVPDGDTGTNLLLTLRAAVQATEDPNLVDVGSLAEALARGALMGARGNSGVILSQYLRGLARGLAGEPTIDGPVLARALVEASRAARAAVEQPVEGTILTVATDVATVAASAAAAGASLLEVVDQAVAEARESVARTRDLLPVLRQANVVDAGGMGLFTILEGMALGLRGEDLPPPDEAVRSSPAAARLEPGRYGYCTEFLIRGARLEASVIRSQLAPLGDSLLVVGDGTILRVHLHTHAPGRAIDVALAHGGVEQIKIEDMQQQHRHLRESAPDPTTASSALLAVVAGDGFGELYRSLGAAIVPGGQTLNPSAEEILRVARQVPAPHCVILPNNPNVTLAAQQARALSDKPLSIVPTRNLAEGVAAALAFQPQKMGEENAVAMRRALADVRTGLVTVAVRDARVGHHEIRTGAVLGLVDDQIEVVGETLDAVVVQLLHLLGAAEAEVITLYVGEGVAADETARLQAHLQATWPGQHVELVLGGQPHYPYILACE